MKLKSKKNIPAEIDSETENKIEKVSIESIVSELKENPKFKDFNDDQIKIIAEEYAIEIYEEYQSSFSGPLPHPSILAGYENTLHGSANRILKMVEQNAGNRTGNNRKQKYDS